MINRWIINFDQISLFHIILCTLSAYLLGSIPFSFLLTKYISKADIYHCGDGNPGAHNAWAIGGWKVGVPAIVLDVSKGALPVLLAQQVSGIATWALLPVAIAPILGHAFSPFLHFHRAKAVATTLGVWFGLTGHFGIVAFAIFAISTMAWLEEDSWYVIFGMIGIAFYCLFITGSDWLTAIALCNLLLLLLTHHVELFQPIHVSNRIHKFMLKRRNS